MDHDGQFEREGRVMSQNQVGSVDFCDNLPSPEAFTAQTLNLNETNALTESQSFSLLQKDDIGEHGRIQQACLSSNGKDMENTGRREEDEEEDTDQVMKEEEEEMSEASSSLVRCLSPDTPMTDSSYSETGSLLETPYPFSPGTSPEPTSPVFAVVGPETAYPISQVVLSQSPVKVEPHTSKADPVASNTVPTCFSVSTCTTRPVANHHLLDALDRLAQRGDDTHLPQYLHQVAEAFVLQEDYQWALWCIQLERLYHQRVLENLNTLQEQWESRCRRTSTDVATKHLDTLRRICQSHSRPRAKDAACASLDGLRATSVEGGSLPPCISACQITEGMEQRAEVSSHSQSFHPAIPSMNLAVRLNSPEISATDGEDRHRGLDGTDDFDGSQLTDSHSSDREEEKEGVEYTNSVVRNERHPSTAGEMDQSKPAEQQGGDLGRVQEKDAKREEEEREDKEVVEAVEMEDEGDNEEEEKLKEGDPSFYQKALLVETVISGAELEVQRLHQEALAEEELHQTQESANTCLHQEAYPHQETLMKQQEQDEEEQEEEQEDEDEYEVEQADIVREAASLDQISKLITVEEVSPSSGLVSILKKRSVCVENVGVPVGPDSRPDIPPAKRRVRFSVPNDGYENDVGSVDSCLLLFLLCLVTVVISVGGTALYCALGDAHSSVCQDFSRNADFYFDQIHRGISHIQHWFNPGS